MVPQGAQWDIVNIMPPGAEFQDFPDVLFPDFANAIPILNFLDTLPIFFVIK
jgi:hypothetical protein